MSVSEEREAAVSPGPAGTAGRAAGRDRIRRWQVTLAATGALLVLLVVRNWFLFSTRLYEAADMGANSILIEQARHFTLLIGNYSRDHIHHPGPAYMYVQAAGESVFWAWLHLVPTAWNGELLAVYALNSMWAALVAAVGYGWTRSLRGAAACFAVAVAFAAVHPAVLSTDWMPYLYVAPYLTFVVAAGSVAAGAGRDAWIMALAGWFLIHGHACFLFFVPFISCVVLAVLLWPRRRSLGASVRSFAATQRRVWVPVVVISVLFALPIVLDVILHWPGQFGAYLKFSSSKKAGGHSLPGVLRAALWYWWPHRDAVIVPFAGYALAAAVARWLAPARLRRFLVALLAVNVASTAAFLFYAMTGMDSLTRYYEGYFYWSAPVITVMVIVLGVVGALPRWPGVIAAATAAVLALAALGTAAQTRTSTDSSDPSVLSSGSDTDAGLPGAVRAVATRSGGRVIVIRLDHDSWNSVTGFLVQAERTGVRACVANPVWTFLVTSQFICTHAELAAGHVFWFRPAAPPGSTIIARLLTAEVTAGS